MANFHNLADFFGGRGIDDQERALRLLVAIRGIVRARVLGEVRVIGGDVFLADNGDKVDPCGLQVTGKGFVVGRFGFGEGKGGCGGGFDGAQGAKVVAG